MAAFLSRNNLIFIVFSILLKIGVTVLKTVTNLDYCKLSLYIFIASATIKKNQQEQDK